MLTRALLISVANEYRWPTFTLPTSASSWFARLYVIFKKLGVDQAVADYAAARARGPATNYGPADLNRWGYWLLGAGQTDDALKVFEANVSLYPDDWNAYDSLGEGYMKAGKKELAIKNYQRSLEMNPKNDNAVEMLKQLGVRWTPDGGSR